MTAAEICAAVNGTVAVNVEDASASGVYVGDLLSRALPQPPRAAGHG